jgi:hypothetical protein
MIRNAIFAVISNNTVAKHFTPGLNAKLIAIKSLV